jgi:DNA mismatch repair protein MutS2
MKIFPANNMVIDEFTKLKKIAEAECVSMPGKKMLIESPVLTSYDEICLRLNQAGEFKKIIENGDAFPSDGFSDVTRELQKLAISNSILNPDELIAILQFARGTLRISDFFEKRKTLYPLFGKLSGSLTFEKVIIIKIEEVMDDSGQVKSTASPDLARIRRVLAKKRSDTERLYQQIILKFRKNGWLADMEESMRNGRRVISIYAEQKRTIRGIVHDISTTGKTVFVEPEETIGVNNELYELEQEEKREVLRILKALTQSLRPHSNNLVQYAGFMALCDYTRGRALFAIATQSRMPFIVKQPLIDVKNARHPLLFLYNKAMQKPTVPFSMRLDKNRILVISGPNAGGKTVCMKTIGLLQLMMQSGFLVPVDDNSTMGIFEKLLVDLGDSQSLEYELSTYSSRLANMKTFIDECNDRSLFLIDEFGTGTDPNLGGALAEAVLEELHTKRPFGVITTHYLNLKLFAEKTQGIINGSMAFDPEELKPLYKLIIGKPGSSYAFVVAERSGLSKSLIESASRKIDRKSFELEKLLTKVESDKNYLQEKLKETSQHEKKLDELIKKYGALQTETIRTKNSIDTKLKAKEARLIEEMNRMFKGFMKEWKTAKNKKALIERFSRQLEIKYNKLAPALAVKKEVKAAYDPALFKPGVLVKLNGGNTTGKIESIDGHKAKVLFGDFYTLCKLQDLEPV